MHYVGIVAAGRRQKSRSANRTRAPGFGKDERRTDTLTIDGGNRQNRSSRSRTGAATT
jgi:hypothetical protein